MGEVAVTLKIMPTDPEVDLSALESDLEAALPEGARVRGFDREDVAFGLVAVLSSVIVADDAGGTEAVEEAFADVQQVESVEVLNVGRL